MAGVTGSISIKDNGSAVLRNLRSEQAKLRADAKKTDSVLKSVWDKPRKIKVAADDAKKKIRSVTSELKKIKPVAAVIKAKDTATSTIKKVKGGVSSLARKTASPVIKVVDKATAKIKSITSALGKVGKAVSVSVALAGAAGTVALGGAVSAGMQLEQQQISIEHFVGATNKDLSASEVKTQSQSYIAELRENANATPFETGDVIQAGSRAAALAGGDTKSAMDMVRLAEDMAAASGGTKSIMVAMEALGDLKVGETERLKEFGFKVSADEYQAKGYEGVTGDLQGFYGGAAEKLAGSGAGLMSTITGKLKSNAADFGLGVVEQLKPVLSDVISLIDEAQPAIQNMSAAFGQGLSSAISLARGAFETLGPAVSTATAAIGPAFAAAAPIVQQAGTVMTAIASGMSSAFGTIAPVVGTVVAGITEKIGGVVSFLSERAGFIQEVISTAGAAIAEVLSTAWSIASPILDLMIAGFELVFSVVQKVWPGISGIISAAWDTISGIFDAIAKGAELVSGAFQKVTGLGGGKKGASGSKAGKNARGDNNWRGGLTWVGEEGPELIDLPKGTRILPNKESVTWAASNREADIIQFRPQGGRTDGIGSGRTYNINISKIADTVSVRSEEDADRIAELTAKKVIEELDNTA